MDYKILVIDDDDDHRFIITECIKEAGYTNIIVAVNGEEGLEMVKTDKPDIVITDTDLGGVDGFEVCKRIKDKFPHIKVVVMTGHAVHVDFPKATEVGADEYKVKTGNCGEIIWGLKRCVASLQEKDKS